MLDSFFVWIIEMMNNIQQINWNYFCDNFIFLMTLKAIFFMKIKVIFLLENKYLVDK